MAAELSVLVDDLVTESVALRGVLDQLGPAEWSLPTPATGWSVGDHVSHLAYFDEMTLQSLVDPDQFRRDAELLTAGGDDFPDRIAAEHRRRSGTDLLAWFLDARAALVNAYRGVDPVRRLPWYGPELGTHRRRRPCHGGRHRVLSRGDAAEAPRRYRLGRDRFDCAAVDRSRASICRSGRTGAATAASQRSHSSGWALEQGGETLAMTIPTINDQRSTRSDDDVGHP
jgi:uncharacterized protein (TIGR03083 family)